ncbi:unnamed protein product [Leptidea sinapis]|uniref:Uncharacterized protein n=1 Tax=Leptidea sinapis TaxID=189913 RepID=A0A5E4R3B5_9NEOP|nr:unnamed protein product [Leptidea sinapis]
MQQLQPPHDPRGIEGYQQIRREYQEPLVLTSGINTSKTGRCRVLLGGNERERRGSRRRSRRARVCRGLALSDTEIPLAVQPRKVTA